MEADNVEAAPLNRGPAKRLTLCLYLLTIFLSGLAVQFLEEGTSTYKTVSLFFTLVGIIILMRWFFLDALEQRYKFSKPMLLGLVAFSFLAAPVYFLQTRGKAAWQPILRGLGFVILAFGVGALGSGLGYLIQLNFL